MRQFKISCHAISQIMAGSIGLTDKQTLRLDELQTRKFNHERGYKGVKPLTDNMEAELKDLINKRDNPELPAGAKTYIKTWIKEKMFNRKKDWKNVVVEKGIVSEPLSIELLGRVLGIEMFKNDEFFENDYAHGFPDIIQGSLVRDVKSSWDIFTFPMFDTEMPNDDYWWQLQGYMWLTGHTKASLDYVLIDTPEPLIALDLKKLYYQSGGLAEMWTPDTHQELLPNYQFNDVPEKYRIKSYEVEWDASVPDKIIQRVQMCRAFIKNIVPSDLHKIELSA